MPKPPRNARDVLPAHRREVPPYNARRTCGICGGEARRLRELAYLKWKREKRVCVQWECQNCKTVGNVLRDTETGEVLRLSHVITGTGFEVVGEDDLSADPEGWRAPE